MTTITRGRTLIAATCALAGLYACSDAIVDPAGQPQPQVQLSVAGVDHLDGAISFVMTGAVVDTIFSPNIILARTARADSTMGLFTGVLRSASLGDVRLARGSSPTQLKVRVLEVADANAEPGDEVPVVSLRALPALTQD